MGLLNSILAAGTAAAAPPVAAGLPNGVANAIQTGGAMQSAASKLVSDDPFARDYKAEMDKTAAAKEKAAAEIEARSAEAAKLRAVEEPKVVTPRLTPLPAAPVEPHPDPLRALGQFLPVMAALGALTTRTPAVAALNAMTSAINAAKVNDKEALQKAHIEWKDQLEATLANNNQLTAQYRLDLEDRSLSIQDRMAKIQGLAAQNQDALTLAGLRSGNPDGLLKLWEVRDKTAEQLSGIWHYANQDDLAREKIKLDELQGWAKLEIDRRNAGHVSMGDAAGTILDKIAKSGVASLTQGEKDALQQYKELSESRQPSPFPPVPGAPAAGAPAGPGAAASVTAAPAAAPVTSVPPVSMLTEGVITPFRDKAGNSKGSWTLRGGKPVQVSPPGG